MRFRIIRFARPVEFNAVCVEACEQADCLVASLLNEFKRAPENKGGIGQMGVRDAA